MRDNWWQKVIDVIGEKRGLVGKICDVIGKEEKIGVLKM